MATLYTFLIYIHVSIGFVALILFWIPIASRKGSKRHARTGWWYTNAMYVVSGSALLLSLILLSHPISAKFPEREFSAVELSRTTAELKSIGLFLLAISILVTANLRHGILTLRAKHDHSLMRAPNHLILNGLLLCVGLYLAFIAADAGGRKILFYVFAALCVSAAVGQLRYSLKKQIDPMEWLIAHLGSMLGAGIGVHTAFFVFGGSRFIAELLTGQWMLVPWVGPGVIGGVAITWLSSKYRNKYRHLRERSQKRALVSG